MKVTQTKNLLPASQSVITSLVCSARPPSIQREAAGRTKASLDVARKPIRVLSPRMLPPVMQDEGSIGSTATRLVSEAEVELDEVEYLQKSNYSC